MNLNSPTYLRWLRLSYLNVRKRFIIVLSSHKNTVIYLSTNAQSKLRKIYDTKSLLEVLFGLRLDKDLQKLEKQKQKILKLICVYENLIFVIAVS